MSISETPCFFVLETNIVIARDVVEALSDQQPKPLVFSAGTLRSALGQIRRMPYVTAAFLASPLDDVRNSGLDAEIVARGGQVVLCGSQAQDALSRSRGWLYLPRPFTTDMIQALARTILRTPRSRVSDNDNIRPAESHEGRRAAQH